MTPRTRCCSAAEPSSTPAMNASSKRERNRLCHRGEKLYKDRHAHAHAPGVYQAGPAASPLTVETRTLERARWCGGELAGSQVASHGHGASPDSDSSIDLWAACRKQLAAPVTHGAMSQSRAPVWLQHQELVAFTDTQRPWCVLLAAAPVSNLGPIVSNSRV